MSTATVGPLPRTGPAIRDALLEHRSAEDAERFVTELREALRTAENTLDVGEADTVIDRWHALATMARHALSASEQTQLDRARAGDVSGFRARDEDGRWVTL